MGRKALDLSSGRKHCARCNTTKSLDDFGKSTHTVHGYQVYCKACSYKRHDKWRRKNLERMATHQREWRRKNVQRARDYLLKQNYGIPFGTYEKMLAQQNGRCAICGTDKPNGRGVFHVDHDHDTHEVRSLLCHNCNIGISHFKHNPKLLDAARAYLKKFNQKLRRRR